MWFYCLYSWRWFTEPILSLCTLLFTFQSTLKLEAIVQQNIKSKFLCIRILLLQRPDENQGVLITINIFFFLHFIPSEFRALCIPILEKFKQILPDIVYDSKCIIGRWPETHFLPPAQIRSIQNTRNTDWITGEVAFLIISRFFSWKKINKKDLKNL